MMRVMRNGGRGTHLNIHFGRVVFYAVPLLLLTRGAGSKGNVQAAGPAGPPAPLVTVIQASSQDVPRYLDEIGRNVAYESVNVTPQVGGRITERHFQDGEDLKKGQLLFVIDPRPYKHHLDSPQPNLPTTKPALH